MTGTAPSASSVLERRARVEVAAALLGVVERQQDLRDGDAVPRQRLLIGMGEPDLAGGGGGLLLLELERAAGQAEMAAAAAMAPEETISTSCRRARQRATSSASASSQARLISPWCRRPGAPSRS